jgi:hypothetical protein
MQSTKKMFPDYVAYSSGKRRARQPTAAAQISSKGDRNPTDDKEICLEWPLMSGE